MSANNFKGRENVYVCQKCGGYTVTVDRDEGTTPFAIRCRAQDSYRFALANGIGCEGVALSSFYPQGPRPPHIPAPSWEWYQPDAEELAATTDPGVLYHLQRGGLLLRAIAGRTH